MGGLSNLRSLSLDGNQLTGPIPTELGDLSNLRSLDLDENQLTGPIPTELGDLSNLGSLDLGENQLTGAIPSALGNLSNLELLWLGGNQLTGAIPSTLGNLSNLQGLDLCNNQLTGAILAELGSLSNLVELDLCNNQLDGAIPSELGDLSNLDRLDLSGNQLTESIPVALGNLSNLRFLNLGDNQLTGTIPAALGNLRSLEWLYLFNNQLEGTLPSALRRVKVLRIGGNLSTFGLPLSITITTTADTLTPEFATFDAETDPCGTVVDLAQFPAEPTLREALIYANDPSVSKPITITFAPSLDNQTIILTDSLPSLGGGGITLDGDDAYGSPSITLDSAGVPADLEVLTIRSADNTIKNLRITNVPDIGILVWHTESFGETVTNNEIILNAITGGQYGIVVRAGSADEAGTLSNTDVLGNFVSETTVAGIHVFAVYAGSTITDTEVEWNFVFENTGSGITAWSSAVNTARVDSITKLKIRENFVHDHEFGSGISIASGACEGSYNRMQAEITNNTLDRNGQENPLFPAIAAGGGTVPLSCSSGVTATHNHLDVTITDNSVEDTDSIGIAVYGGYQNSNHNTVTARVERNAVWRSSIAGISLSGGATDSDSNTVTVTLNDNLIARATEPDFGTAGHGLALVAASAIPSTSTSSNNTLTVSGRGNVISIKRNTSDTTYYDLFRQEGNDTTAGRTGNTLTDDALTGTSFATQGGDAFNVKPKPEPPAPVTVSDTHPEVAAFTVTPVSEEEQPSTTQFTAGTTVFDVTVEDEDGEPVEGPLTEPVQVCLPIPQGVSSSQAYIFRYNEVTKTWSRQTTGRVITDGFVCVNVSEFSLFTVGRYRRSVSTGGGGGGGGGGGSSRDQHGNTPAQATVVSLGEVAPWMASTAGQINAASDIDYFALSVPHDGVLVVETTGRTDTMGTVWQDGEELATADSGGERRNFLLSVRVEAGPVVVAVEGARRRTGAYTLETTLLVGLLENPGTGSFQSGVSVLSGWLCDADIVEIVLDDRPPQVAAYGTERLDTEEICGDSDNGFGLLFNWNRLEDGEHTARALADGVEFGRATFTVTTLGEEFVRGVEGETLVQDFPSPGKVVRLVWQQGLQNFMLAPLDGSPAESPTGPDDGPMGILENPGPGSWQSGIGVLSGWVCEADMVEVVLDDRPVQLAAYGTERADTEAVCGDTDNGFGLLFNWNRLEDGVHTVRALADGEEFGRATFTVTTLGTEFLRGIEGETVVPDFPSPGEAVRLRWQESNQNFVITSWE